MSVATITRPKTFTCRTTAEWLRGHGIRFSGGLDKPALLIMNPPEIDGKAGEWTPEDLLIGAIETCLAMTFATYADKTPHPQVRRPPRPAR